MITRRADLDLLITWALATFHASFFLLAFVIFLYLVDVLRNVLPGLNTALGLALFAVLWGITFYTTKRALKETEGDDAFIHRAVKWGGFNGVLFLWAILVPAGIAITLATGNLVSVAIGLPFYGLIGSIVAYAIGGVAGLILGTLDLLLLSSARRLVREALS